MAKRTEDLNWTTTPPNKPGWYWFYGDPHLGTMGCDFFPDFTTPDEEHRKLYLVEVVQLANGIAAIASGNFMSLSTFHKKLRGEGHLGYWAEAELPEPPAWDLTIREK